MNPKGIMQKKIFENTFNFFYIVIDVSSLAALKISALFIYLRVFAPDEGVHVRAFVECGIFVCLMNYVVD